MSDYSTLFMIILGLIVLYFLYRFFAPYFVRITNIFYVSGSPGTGKDVISHKYALARYYVAIRKWRKEKRIHNFKQLFKKKKDRILFTSKPPILMSSIPLLIRYHKKRDKQILSHEIDLDVILLKKRLPRYSVVYISDINRFINQHSYKNVNVRENIAEFISQYRHYTYGGYFISNSQASSQVAKEIRMTFGKVRNNLSFKRFLCFYRVEGRTITLSEDVLNVEQGDGDKKNQNATYIYGFLNPFIKRYDSYAYYGRITKMDFTFSVPYVFANTNYLFTLPVLKQTEKTINYIDDYKKYFKFDKLTAFLYFSFSFVIGVILAVWLNTTIPLFILLTICALMVVDARN